MKLLLDQNLSYKIVRLLSSTFKYTSHVRHCGLLNATDIEIWQYAKANNFTIVTYDSDFIDLSVIKSSLPKIIWLRFGNATNLKIANKLIKHQTDIVDFITNNTTDELFVEIF